MIETDKMYGDAFFKGRNRFSWRAPIVCDSIMNVYSHQYGRKPESAADVGCAVGDLVQGFADLGLDAWGFEGSAAAKPYVECDPERWHVLDLRKPLGLGWEDFRLDVVTCFEVLEHLEESCARQAVQNLVDMSDVLITSACPPHPTKKATKYHLNEQFPEYWDALFEHHGYRRQPAMEQLLKDAWFPWRKKYGIAAFYQNLLVYTLGGA